MRTWSAGTAARLSKPKFPKQKLGSQKGTPLQPKVTELHIAHMLFQEAAEVWLATRTSYIYGKTFHE
jgi:hypothetical protein